VVLKATPSIDSLAAPLAPTTNAQGDVETGEGESVSWRASVAKAASHARQKTVDAAGHAQQGLSHGLERARSFEWSERVKVKGMQRSVSQGLETASETISSARSSIQEKLDDSGMTQKAREGMSSVAGVARSAAASVHSSSVAAVSLARDPVRLMLFFGVFLFGALFVVGSVYFLPLLVIAPLKFAGLFTVGSLTMVFSFMILTGPVDYLQTLASRRKWPFSTAYILSLVGTIWAALIKRSCPLTVIFAVIQAFALLYFVVSFLPFGTTVLNMMGRAARRITWMIVN